MCAQATVADGLQIVKVPAHIARSHRCWRRDAQTLRAAGWRSIVVTRSELNRDDPDVIGLPAALPAWLLDS